MSVGVIVFVSYMSLFIIGMSIFPFTKWGKACLTTWKSNHEKKSVKSETPDIWAGLGLVTGLMFYIVRLIARIVKSKAK